MATDLLGQKRVVDRLAGQLNNGESGDNTVLAYAQSAAADLDKRIETDQERR